MSEGKRFKGKPCAYCGVPGSSSTADHVVARSFFLVEDRIDLPKVAACRECNSAKSDLENYVGATLLAGSRHEEADRYRVDHVRPRLAKNARLSRELDLGAAPKWVWTGSMFQPMNEIRVDAKRITQLLEFVVRGLYCFHFGEPLDPGFAPEVTMLMPEREPPLLAALAEYFPPGSEKCAANLGRRTFVYEGLQSPAAAGFSMWKMALHGGIPLHGQGAPPRGVSHWWGVTRPTPAALAAAEANTPPSV